MSWLKKFLKLGSSARLVGIDLRGNQYFEKATEGGRQYKRHVKVKEIRRLEEYTQETIPPEWDRWLRGLRKDPPSEEEQTLRVQQSEALKHKIINVNSKDAERRSKEIADGLVADSSGTKAVDHASSPSFKPDTSEEPTSTGKDFHPGSWKP